MNRNLTRSNQNREMSPWAGFRDEIWDILERFTQDMDVPSLLKGEFTPKIEVKELGNAYQICAEVPGMNEKDINVTLQNNNLIIEGEKKNEVKDEDKKKGIYHTEFSYGRFRRSIPIGEDIDSEKISATYKDGLLMIELPRNPQKSSNARKIEVSSSSKSQRPESRH
jgi:HSP20 family protein